MKTARCLRFSQTFVLSPLFLHLICPHVLTQQCVAMECASMGAGVGKDLTSFAIVLQDLMGSAASTVRSNLFDMFPMQGIHSLWSVYVITMGHENYWWTNIALIDWLTRYWYCFFPLPEFCLVSTGLFYIMKGWKFLFTICWIKRIVLHYILII